MKEEDQGHSQAMKNSPVVFGTAMARHGSWYCNDLSSI